MGFEDHHVFVNLRMSYLIWLCNCYPLYVQAQHKLRKMYEMGRLTGWME